MRDKSDLIRKHPIMGIDDMHRGVIASEHLSELPLSDRFQEYVFRVCRHGCGDAFDSWNGRLGAMV